ncbi:cubilin-like [Littorina saxatilis]|uniref:cubilin-like n=1 Tax=Littorina saxatilis TaxID=31220 RepID=UPI0038B436CE
MAAAACKRYCVWSSVAFLVLLLPVLLTDAQVSGCKRHVMHINVTSSGGVLYSPGYPEEYPDSELCTWLLTSREVGKVLQLRPLDLRVGRKVNQNGLCVGDVLTAYDGNNTKSRVLHTWCGGDESVAHSTKDSVLLQLVTNDQRRYRGFAIKYSLLTLSDNTCDGTFVKTIPLEKSAVVADFSSPVWTFFPNLPGTCSWRLVADDVTSHVVIDLEKFDNGLLCEDGNFSIYDGPETTSPEVVRWCARSAKPFTSVYLSGSQGLVVIRTRPNVTSSLRFKFYTRAKLYRSCSLQQMPTLELKGEEPTFIGFPFAVNSSGKSCPVRLLSSQTLLLWARIDVMEVEGQPATCNRSLTGSPLAVLQANETDGNINVPQLVPQSCWRGDHPVYWPVAESVIISPAKNTKRLLLKVTPARHGACHGRVLHRVAPSDEALAIRHPALSSRDFKYSRNAWCRYVIGGESPTDHVLSRVEGELCELEESCDDYVRIYDGTSTDSPLLYDSGHENHLVAYVISTGRYVTYEVVTDEKANRGFIQASFNSVPVMDLCNGVKNIKAARHAQNLSSINYPQYYPVNYICQYCISAENPNDVIHINVIDSDLTYSCADAVEVFDGSDSGTAMEYLGRFCGRDTPSFVSKQAGLCLLFRSDPSLHGRGWLLSYHAAPPSSADTKSAERVVATALPSLSASSSSSSSAGTEVIVLAVLLALVTIALIVLIVVFVLKTRQQRQQMAV